MIRRHETYGASAEKLVSVGEEIIAILGSTLDILEDVVRCVKALRA